MADKNKPTKTKDPKKPIKKFFKVANWHDLSEEEKDKILDDIISKVDEADGVEPNSPVNGSNSGSL